MQGVLVTRSCRRRIADGLKKLSPLARIEIIAE